LGRKRNWKYKNKRVSNFTIIIVRPDKATQIRSEDGKRKMRNYFRRRAAIEPTIRHLKPDHRVYLNFLKGIAGDSLNFIMALRRL
jgi:IS5 family transposase